MGRQTPPSISHSSVAAGQPATNSSRTLPKLIIPSSQQPFDKSPLSSQNHGAPGTTTLDSWHTPIEDESEWTSGGRLGKSLNGLPSSPLSAPALVTVPTSPVVEVPATNPGSFRGSAKATASPTTREQPSRSPVAAQAQLDSVRLATPVPTSAPSSDKKKPNIFRRILRATSKETTSFFRSGKKKIVRAARKLLPSAQVTQVTRTTTGLNSKILSSPQLPAPESDCPPRPISALAPSVTAQEPADAASAPLSGKKRAVLIGLNYTEFGNKDFQLTRATRDARRFANTLTGLGYSSEDMRVVTDEEDQRLPSSEYLIECMDWLVKDASKGDHLFFMFSGHGEPPKRGHSEPYLVAADLMDVPRSVFQEHLVSKIPAGVELTMVLDCCNAAGMVDLKYCVGKMEYEREVPAVPRVPQLSSLRGMPAVDQGAPLPPHSAPIMTYPTPLRTPVVPRRGDVVAAPTLRVGAGPVPAAIKPTPLGTPANAYPHVSPGVTAAPSLSPQGAGSGAAGASSSANRRVGRQLVFEGRPLKHFEERQSGFVSPAGKVVLLAGTGLRQKAFEPSTGTENSIVTEAVCSSLCKSLNGKITMRDVWHSVVKAVDEENTLRNERDAKNKDVTKVAPNTRTQCAQVWASQEEPLSSSSPVLDQPVFAF